MGVCLVFRARFAVRRVVGDAVACFLLGGISGSRQIIIVKSNPRAFNAREPRINFRQEPVRRLSAIPVSSSRLASVVTIT